MLSKSDIANLQKLQDKKGREGAGSFIVEGVKGVLEAFKYATQIKCVVVDESRQLEADKQEVIAVATARKIPVFETSKLAYKSISGTVTPAGILAEVALPNFTVKDFFPGPVIALDRISDPGNLGTIIRTAEWFRISNIILSEGCVDPYNEKVVRSTMGSLHRARIVRVENIAETLEGFERKGYNVTSFTLGGTPLETFTPNKKSILVFGSESHGVSEEITSRFPKQVTISGGGETESLNVAVAAGIALHHIHTHIA
jgi:TrmH family RNA methyltransferase